MNEINLDRVLAEMKYLAFLASEHNPEVHEGIYARVLNPE